MSWRDQTDHLRAALKAQGFKRGDVSIVAKSSAQITATIKCDRVRDAAQTLAKAWYERHHAWLFLWVYDATGRNIFGDLSDGYIPPRVAVRIAGLPNPAVQPPPTDAAGTSGRGGAGCDGLMDANDQPKRKPHV